MVKRLCSKCLAAKQVSVIGVNGVTGVTTGSISPMRRRPKKRKSL
ncbi:unnamed protein product [Leptidea sinapis]|uniref:Uncharacterized protein n=1 Tax=Leptidea sinapis TaxID=189913 RepID=A0A5E4R519_9NEOP|nr:unnamed protein product [Leptidea sinapis]